MSAADALITMSAQSGSAASHYGVKHLAMRPCEVRAVLLPEAVARGADDIGHLEGGVTHRLMSFRERFTVSRMDTVMDSIGLGIVCRCRRERWR